MLRNFKKKRNIIIDMIVKAIKREFKNENKINLFNCHRSRHMWVIFFRTSTFFFQISACQT